MTTSRRRLLLSASIAALFVMIPGVGFLFEPVRGLLISLVVTQALLVLILLRVWLSLDGADAQRTQMIRRELQELARTGQSGIGTAVAKQLQGVEQATLKLTGDVTGQLDESRVQAAGRMLEHERRLWGLHGETARRLEATIEERFGVVEKRLHELDRAVLEHRKKAVSVLTAVSAKQFTQLEALQALYHDLQPPVALPPTRSWVASPDLLHHLYQWVRTERPQLIVECGSGLSTVVMAYGIRAAGYTGRVVALEHLEKYARITRSMIEDHGLTDIAEVRLAPLSAIELDGKSWLWYDRSHVPAGSIDLLLVDGPPGSTQEQARYPALPILRSHLSPGATVVLDDYLRPEEAEVVERWIKEVGGLELSELKHEKGTAILRVTDS